MEVVILRNDRSALAQKYGEFSEGRTENYKDIDDIKNALMRMGIPYKEVVVKEDLSNLKEIKKINPDVVINVCDDFLEPKKEALVPKKLETLGVAYTGDAYQPLMMCAQKALSKKKLIEAGVLTPKYQLVSSPEGKIKDLKYPLIVKPNNEHGSVGIESDSVVHTEEQLQKKLNEMLAKYGKMLVEEYIDGREISTVVIGDKVMRVSEIVFDGQDFAGKPTIMTYDSKWKENSPDYVGTVRKPADLPKKLEEKIKETSKKAYDALGCKGYARVDLRVTPEGEPYVIEVNVNPDLSRDGAFAKIMKDSRVSYLKLIKMIIENAQGAETENKEQRQEENQIEEKKAVNF
ncbi:MAG: ATP-grasp domain-containing protein [Candidatus Nanoarchaeia archaeon]